MTENEAMKKLSAYHKCQILQVKGIYEDCNEDLCDNCDLCYAQGNAGEHIESVDIAINALKKQIPIKPMFSYNEIVKEKWFYCGVCAFGFGFGRKKIKHYKYCPDCGQKLDWGDEE